MPWARIRGARRSNERSVRGFGARIDLGEVRVRESMISKSKSSLVLTMGVRDDMFARMEVLFDERGWRCQFGKVIGDG